MIMISKQWTLCICLVIYIMMKVYEGSSISFELISFADTYSDSACDLYTCIYSDECKPTSDDLGYMCCNFTFGKLVNASGFPCFPCDPNPCKNNGYCQEDWTNIKGYICNCLDGVTGYNCQVHRSRSSTVVLYSLDSYPTAVNVHYKTSSISKMACYVMCLDSSFCVVVAANVTGDYTECHMFDDSALSGPYQVENNFDLFKVII